MKSTRELLEAVRADLEGGRAHEAVRALRTAFRSDEPFGESDFTSLTLAFSEAARVIAGADLGDLLAKTAASPNDTIALYDAGYQLYEYGLYEVAIAMLARAHRLSPGDVRIVYELVTCYEVEQRHAEALRVIDSLGARAEGEFVLRYMRAFQAILAGNLARGAREALRIKGATDVETTMEGRIRSMLDRAKAIENVSTLEANDLRGWQFVATGSLVLHVSPFGFGDGMNGRYAFTADSYERCHAVVARLRVALSHLGATVPRVLLPNDSWNRGLGTYVALALGVPSADLDDGPGLVVAYDLERLDEREADALRFRYENQLVFAHSLCWTTPPGFAPEFVGYFQQTNSAPWGERLGPGTEGRRVDRIPEELLSADEIATRIAGANGPWTEEIAPADTEEAFEAFTKSITRAFPKTPGERSPFWNAGPVHSSRFM